MKKIFLLTVIVGLSSQLTGCYSMDFRQTYTSQAATIESSNSHAIFFQN